MFHSLTQIEAKKRTSGCKHSVDFTMNGVVEKDTALYIIPIEAKKELGTQNVAQLAQYMTTMVKGQYVHANTTTEMLIDATCVRLAFSTLCDDTNDVTPLPIAFVSPPVKWWDGVVPPRPLCICMFLLQSLRQHGVLVSSWCCSSSHVDVLSSTLFLFVISCQASSSNSQLFIAHSVITRSVTISTSTLPWCILFLYFGVTQSPCFNMDFSSIYATYTR